MNLSSTIKSIQDIMRKDDGVDGDAQRLGQLTWMLFLKVFDQREEEWADDNPAYISPLPNEYRWRNWAAYIAGVDGKKKPQIAGSELISFVNNELFPTLKEIDANKSPRHKVIRSVFEDANNYMKSGPQMLAVIEKLEDAINFHDFTIRANIGDVYEQLLNDLRGAGNAGEFYTPRAITAFMVDRINPRLDKRETVMDPACGTGGFLTAAIEHFRNQLATMKLPRPEDKRAIESLILGIEKKQLPHLLCTTNMLLHGIDVPSQIEHKNTLGIGWNEWKASDKVDCIITNPPFGGYEDDGVGSDYPADLRTRETADMFMALIIKKLLKEKGRAAVVLPDGFLFGEGIKGTLKKLLLRDCKLHTIIRLPKGVFAPYTTIKTNLLFFTKGSTVDDGTEYFHTDTIWYYEHPYPAGYKSYSKTKPIRLEEFEAERNWWGSEDNDFADRVENGFAWKVDFKTKREQAEAAAQPYWQRAEELNNQAAVLESEASDLRRSLFGTTDAAYRERIDAQIAALRVQVEPLRLQARDAQAAGDRIYWPIFNLDIKNPNTAEEETLDPDVLLEKYKKLLGEIEETENQLKSELAAVLAHHFVDEDA
ncbi:MAG: type I restriction-modification system subunit M [Ewingella americana]|jgi:type I restriction enzyme M protein|uniref:class I SAM-dependent DNA methyltransferase n=1 Tax=Ewingella americana TaxID=41202 RepID=UPI00242CB2F4|nr:N-6 DNA methylase [Ewingella americana]MCI1678084.1 type I restriction-modification system subunit M [Ewingella americana]MCI1855972.1 type I restriction-modification system subunit M [Ewingella americana]MCI1863458.1 type I restriction-modification system subunit M [Ewingella americana]MCI2144120.1 type I restriction-modification system subunit M [Ewingella americana]MCI2163972.1 type I restriction-modification system subunit M [Ewingella americana]